jgi:hypothetical protein
MSARRKTPPSPLGDSGWKKVSSRAFQRSLNLGNALLTGRVSTADAKKAQWNAVVSLRLGGATQAGLDEMAETADAAIERCDGVLADLCTATNTRE